MTNNYSVFYDEEFGTHSVEATIDNGDFGSRIIRLETGQLARQAMAPSSRISTKTP